MHAVNTQGVQAYSLHLIKFEILRKKRCVTMLLS